MSTPWNATIPNTGSNMVDTPWIYGNNWLCIDAELGLQHYDFTHPTSGQHLPGEWPAVASGTTAAITATSSPACGAIASDITDGTHRIYYSSQWQQVNMLPHSCVIAYRSLDYVVPYGVSTVPFDTPITNTINDYNMLTYTFTAMSDGYYNFVVNMNIVAAGGVGLNLAFNQYGSSGNLKLCDTRYFEAMSTDIIHLMTDETYFMSAGDYAYISVNNTQQLYTVKLSGGPSYNYLGIYRI